jgi:hypothetical protein
MEHGAKSIENCSAAELRNLLAGLGGTFSGNEKKELVEEVVKMSGTITVKELKQKLAERNIQIPPGSGITDQLIN